ncbi:MAG: CBS domain-containing protein [Chromatiales bacterium]|nr:CBS domain-containing protein [Chromatiales bacterium]
MTKKSSDRRPQLEDYQRALESMQTFMDITADDLMTLAQQAEHYAQLREHESLTIREIMTQPVHVIHADTRMSEAADIMVSKRISGLPVVDNDKKLIGILTEADFLRELGVPFLHPSQNVWETLGSLFSHTPILSESNGPDDFVKNHMSSNVVTIEPDKSVHDAVDLMKQHLVKRLLVSTDGKVEGVVTRSNLVRLFFARYTNQHQQDQ